MLRKLGVCYSIMIRFLTKLEILSIIVLSVAVLGAIFVAAYYFIFDSSFDSFRSFNIANLSLISTTQILLNISVVLLLIISIKVGLRALDYFKDDMLKNIDTILTHQRSLENIFEFSNQISASHQMSCAGLEETNSAMDEAIKAMDKLENSKKRILYFFKTPSSILELSRSLEEINSSITQIIDTLHHSSHNLINMVDALKEIKNYHSESHTKIIEKSILLKKDKQLEELVQKHNQQNEVKIKQPIYEPHEYKRIITPSQKNKEDYLDW